ncbi:MAG: hybrid sensor histidine kinase/response regulator, partial [Devosia sp.]|nr:hybrid sensor histidine kinase/response regulator [Devosia sp.]
EHDWSTSPLGDPESWSRALRTIVALMLQSKFPMFVAWGSELGFLYNDAYAQILGSKHPKALGGRFDQIWGEIWPDISPLIDAALRGEATYQEDMPLVLNRAGFDEQTWFTFSYSPVLDGDDSVGGMFCVVAETTQTVIGERRNAFRLSLERKLRGLADPVEIMAAGAQALGQELSIARVGYGEIDPSGETVTVERDWTDGSIGSVSGRHRLDNFGPEIISELRAGRIMWVDDVNNDPRVGPSAEAFAAINTRAVLAVPLFKNRRFAAMLYLHHPEPHQWTESETGLAREVVEQTWQAVERATAEARLRELNSSLERRIADALAESLKEQQKLRETERARRESDALYRAYFENAPEALFMVRVEPDGGFIAEEINPSHEAGVGFKIADIRGKRIEEFMPAEAAQKVLDAYRKVVESGLVLQYRDSFEINGGPQHWDTSVVPVREPDGRITRLIGSSRNVTRQIIAEETLRQTQKMEAMGQLTGGVAHDFNNLLTPILGTLDRLQRKGTGDEREQRLIGNALLSADRARTLVQRLLAFARRQPLQPTAVDLSKLVHGMADLLSATMGPQIHLVVEAPADIPPANGDANQIEMALLNLVVNARDAMPDHGGTVRITVSAVAETAATKVGLKPGNYVRLSVADTGNGMDQATLDRAIEPFFSTKGIGRGTGLGLSMVHGLAAQLGGALIISSTPGLGTNVELWLALSDDHSDVLEQSNTAAELPNVGKGVALLVDDEDVVRMSTADMLSDLGFEVVEASSAARAIELVEVGLRPDLLITDHLMPGMTGTQLARILLRQGIVARALIISGYAEIEGVDPTIPKLNKPFTRQDLVQQLAQLTLHAS